MNKALFVTGSAIILLAGGLSAEAATTSVAPAIAATAAPVEANSQAMEAADQVKISIRQQIEGQLSKNGYTDVKIMPSSFMVRAKDKLGNPVEMVIGPDSFTEVTEVAPKTAAAPNMTAPSHAAKTNATTPAPKT